MAARLVVYAGAGIRRQVVPPLQGLASSLVGSERLQTGRVLAAWQAIPKRPDRRIALDEPAALQRRQHGAQRLGIDPDRLDSFAGHRPSSHRVEYLQRVGRLDLADATVDVVALLDDAGATGIYVLSGHGLKHRSEMEPGGIIVPGIREAADWVLASQALREQEMRHPVLLREAAALLRQGGVVAFPTETVYGLGALVFNEKAVARIFEVKQRPSFDPLIVHVADVEQLDLLATRVPLEASVLINRFWPGPLTLILPKVSAVPDLVTSGLPTVAVRMPRHPLALELIRQAGMPIAAPSANLFGHTSPTTAHHVKGALGQQIDLVLDGGACSVGIESTIISFCDGPPLLLRPGGVPVEEIEALIGPVARPPLSSQQKVSAPGMLSRHYAPRTQFQVVSGPASACAHAGERTGLLTLKKTARAADFAAAEFLSEQGNLREAAANLFGAMRRLDEQGLERIVAETVPDVGLGRAINDRLIRAAGSKPFERKAHGGA